MFLFPPCDVIIAGTQIISFSTPPPPPHTYSPFLITPAVTFSLPSSPLLSLWKQCLLEQLSGIYGSPRRPWWKRESRGKTPIVVHFRSPANDAMRNANRSLHRDVYFDIELWCLATVAVKNTLSIILHFNCYICRSAYLFSNIAMFNTGCYMLLNHGWSIRSLSIIMT